MNWSDIKLSDVNAINTRIGLAKKHNWVDDLAHWLDVREKEAARYDKMMIELENYWGKYPDAQRMYLACQIAYLRLDGYDVTLNTPEKRKAKMKELETEYYDL